MLSMAYKAAALAVGALLVTISFARAAAIECDKIGIAYDPLFVNALKQVTALQTEFKALPASATEQQKDALRKRYCAVGGELVGYYKFVQALANDCAAQGAAMGPLLDVINKQLNLGQQGIHMVCG